MRLRYVLKRQTDITLIRLAFSCFLMQKNNSSYFYVAKLALICFFKVNALSTKLFFC